MCKKNKQFNEKGIVALFPAIIISSILLILCVSVSQSFLALLYRNQIYEQKAQSDVSVEVCVDRVLAKQAQGVVYGVGDSILVNGVSCAMDYSSTTVRSVIVKLGDAVSVQNIPN